MVIRHDRRLVSGWLGRSTLVLFIVAASAVSAYADPRLVRVIWDVGKGTTYYRVDALTATGTDQFVVPAGAQDAIDKRFEVARDAFLRKGDRVRVYVVNYNGVSHVWHESSVVEQIAQDASLVGPLLNALTLAITGVAALPTKVVPLLRDAPHVADRSDCSLNAVTNELRNLRASAAALGDAAKSLVEQADNAGLATDAKKIAAVPANEYLRNIFDNAEAWHAITTNNQVYGKDFVAAFADITKAIQGDKDKGTKGIQSRIDEVNNAQLTLDRAIAWAAPPLGPCTELLKNLIAQRDNVAAFVSEVAGESSVLRDVLAKYQAASAAWALFKRKLLDHKWRDDAIELIVKEPVKAESVLRIDAAFTSTDKNLQERMQRNVVLGVEPYVPRLVISSGIAGHGFKFKKLEVVKTTVTAADETVAAKSILRTTEDTTWQRLVPVWLEHIRLGQSGDWGTYATFGTTPDRNIFRNGIVAVSAYRPRWRTVLSVGALFARGYEQKDLQPVIEEFSDANGLALADVSSTNVPLPDIRWRKSLFVSVSFGLVTF